MKKLLVICGPTAVGKTGLALHLSKVFGGEIVSADSRQVYRGMDIGTGKDLPVNVKYQMLNVKCDDKNITYYQISTVKVWCYDLVSPKEEFSVAHYEKIVREVISDVWRRKRLPILVGGTGLYIKAVVDGIETVDIPRNVKLRLLLERKSVDELFEQLAQIDPTKAASLNMSDRRNSRRLIRAIEISQSKYPRSKLPMNRLVSSESVMFVGLRTNKQNLEKRINARVMKRLESGFEKEVENLIDSGVTWDSQAMQSLGYRQWQKYYQGKESRKDVIDSWVRAETSYARRQMTWFKKDKRIIWVDVGKPNYRRQVEQLVRKWYYKRNEEN